MSRDATHPYAFDAPKAGKCRPMERLAPPARVRHLFHYVNVARGRFVTGVSRAIGNWRKPEPVQIGLAPGRTLRTFSAGAFTVAGLSISDFRLAPVL